MPRVVPSIVVCMAVLAGSAANGGELAPQSPAKSAASDEAATPDYLLVEVRMVEINRTKMRRLGIDFAKADDQTIGQEPGEPSFDLDTPPGLVQALEKHGIAKEVDRANILLKTNGKAAEFFQGGEVEVPLGDGQSKKVRFGTELKVTANLQKDSVVKLDLDYRFSHLEQGHAIASDTEVPGIHIYNVLSQEIGKTVVLGGMRSKQLPDGEDRELLLIVTTEAAEELAKSMEPTLTR